MTLEQAMEAIGWGLRPLIARGRAVGFVVGLTGDDRTLVKSFGTFGFGPSLTVDTIMEIGSITKTFTGTLLADMVSRGEVDLREPIGRYLPGPTPRLGVREITLLDLATHASGLPRNGGILIRQALRNRREPFARYRVQDLYQQVSRARIRQGIGERFHYSNLGFGLLGHLLGLVTGVPYCELVIERVCRPLGMTDTLAGAPPVPSWRWARGHRRAGAQVPSLRIPTLAGAGVLRSTARDMLVYLDANLRPDDSPLGRALSLAQGPHRTYRRGKISVGLGWIHLRQSAGTLVWHNGGTPGFGAFAGFSPDADAALIVLSNSRYLLRLNGLCFRILGILAA